jgi:Flp pilus assembly protein TadB
MLMRLRAVLAALIVISTVAFVVGTTIERNSKHNERAATLRAEGKTAQAGESGAHRKAERPAPKTTTNRSAKKDAHAGESAAHRAAEGLPPETSTTSAKSKEAHAGESAARRAAETPHKETHAELKPLGVDIEAAPFVALAAVTSLALALGAWLRPRWLLLLVVIAAAMLVFCALDVREVFHQSDESKTGLAVLAGFVALLHLGAAAVAGVMGREARRAPA